MGCGASSQVAPTVPVPEENKVLLSIIIFFPHIKGSRLWSSPESFVGHSHGCRLYFEIYCTILGAFDAPVSLFESSTNPLKRVHLHAHTLSLSYTQANEKPQTTAPETAAAEDTPVKPAKPAEPAAAEVKSDPVEPFTAPPAAPQTTTTTTTPVQPAAPSAAADAKSDPAKDVSASGNSVVKTAPGLHVKDFQGAARDAEKMAAEGKDASYEDLVDMVRAWEPL